MDSGNPIASPKCITGRQQTGFKRLGIASEPFTALSELSSVVFIVSTNMKRTSRSPRTALKHSNYKMGVAAPRNPNRQVVSPRQISDTLTPPSSRQTQPSETSYTLSSVTETAAIIKTTLPVSANRLLTLETSASLSFPVLATTSSSSQSSAVALGMVFGIFFGTIIFSFILCGLCRRCSTSTSSASAWPSSAKATTAMPVRYSSTMRYPQRPTPVRIKSGDRLERPAHSSEAEKVHSTVKVVKVIQSDVPPPNLRRDSQPVSRKGHRRDNSTPRLHPGRQAVVDVSSPTTETWDDGIHRHERSRHDYNPTEGLLVRDRSHQDHHHPPPVIYVAGRTAHERTSRRSRERESYAQHGHTTQSRRRIRRSQPSNVNVVHKSSPAVHAASVSAPAVAASTRRYQQPRYDLSSATTSTSELSDNIGEEPSSLETLSSSSIHRREEGAGHGDGHSRGARRVQGG